MLQDIKKAVDNFIRGYIILKELCYRSCERTEIYICDWEENMNKGKWLLGYGMAIASAALVGLISGFLKSPFLHSLLVHGKL